MPKGREYPDHPRTLALLWRPVDEPSPRTGLTVRRIVEAAIEIADADGLRAVTIRKVADALGVGAMSLYTYVPGKDELVFLMIEAVIGELSPESGAEGWRARLEEIARSYWALHRRHPWLVEVSVTRPVVGPNGMDWYEHELSLVDGIGLDELEMNAVVELLRRHVEGTARYAVEAARDAKRSGMSDDEWWYSVLPVLERVLVGRDYPLSARVGGAIGAPHSDPEHGFEFGLSRILDGVELLVSSRSGSGAK
jgi:AcrR family transcriptional regulator